jgi:hypothetical protein
MKRYIPKLTTYLSLFIFLIHILVARLSYQITEVRSWQD